MYYLVLSSTWWNIEWNKNRIQMYCPGNSTSVVFFVEHILMYTCRYSYLSKNHRYYLVFIPRICAQGVEYSTNFRTGIPTQNKKIPQFKL